MNKIQDFNVNANGFTVLDARDGFRQDNRLWFGVCSECGEAVSNSALDNVWVHTKREKSEIHGGIVHTDFDYCPNK